MVDPLGGDIGDIPTDSPAQQSAAICIDFAIEHQLAQSSDAPRPSPNLSSSSLPTLHWVVTWPLHWVVTMAIFHRSCAALARRQRDEQGRRPDCPRAHHHPTTMSPPKMSPPNMTNLPCLPTPSPVPALATDARILASDIFSLLKPHPPSLSKPALLTLHATRESLPQAAVLWNHPHYTTLCRTRPYRAEPLLAAPCLLPWSAALRGLAAARIGLVQTPSWRARQRLSPAREGGILAPTALRGLYLVRWT